MDAQGHPADADRDRNRQRNARRDADPRPGRGRAIGRRSLGAREQPGGGHQHDHRVHRMTGGKAGPASEDKRVEFGTGTGDRHLERGFHHGAQPTDQHQGDRSAPITPTFQPDGARKHDRHQHDRRADDGQLRRHVADGRVRRHPAAQLRRRSVVESIDCTSGDDGRQRQPERVHASHCGQPLPTRHRQRSAISGSVHRPAASRGAWPPRSWMAPRTPRHRRRASGSSPRRRC